MSGIKITDRGGMGIQIDVPFTTDLGTLNQVQVAVYESGINVVATSTLNADGLQALKQALAIAEAIQARGFSK